MMSEIAIADLDPRWRKQVGKLQSAVENGDSDFAIALAERVLGEFPQDGEAEALLKDASVALSLMVGNWEEQGDYRQKLSNQSEAESLEQDRRHSSPEQSLREDATRLEAELLENPSDLRRYRDLAKTWSELGEPQAALECIEKARQQSSLENDISLSELVSELEGEVLKQRLKTVETEAILSSGENVSETVEVARRALQAHERKRLGMLVNQYPLDGSYRIALGEMLLSEGDADNAAQQFQKAVDSPKHRTGALMGLGRAFKLRDRHDLALKQFDKALSENAEMTVERKAAMYEKADTAFLLGRNEDAREAFAAIFEVDVAYRDVSERLDALSQD